MRVSFVLLFAVFGGLALSINAQPQETPSVGVPKSMFLSNIKVGETIIVQSDEGAITIFAGQNEQQVRKLLIAEQEERIYQEAVEVLEQHRKTGTIEMEKRSDHLKQIYEQPGGISGFVSRVQARKTTMAHRVSRVGEDFIAYKENDREVFIPMHQIQFLTGAAE